MLYDFKKKQVIQDVIVDDLAEVCRDIVKQAKRNSRYETVDIYAPSAIIKDIYYYLLSQDSKFKEEKNYQKYLLDTHSDLILTINTNLQISLEKARNQNEKLKYSYSRLCYFYDSLSKNDLKHLEKFEESILVFGLENDSIYYEFL